MSVNLSKQRPEQWAYTKMLHGKHINALHLVSMFKKHHQQEKFNLLMQVCGISGKIAIAARHMTKRQRLKYGANRLQDGRRTFYLFDRHMCPADVGVLVDLKEGPIYI